MSRKKLEPKVREESERLVREVVTAVVPERDRERYMAFGRELCATLKRPVGADYSRRSKAVVSRWFRRGLHGNLLWRIGVGLLGRMYPDAATGKVED